MIHYKTADEIELRSSPCQDLGRRLDRGDQGWRSGCPLGAYGGCDRGGGPAPDRRPGTLEDSPKIGQMSHLTLCWSFGIVPRSRQGGARLELPKSFSNSVFEQLSFGLVDAPEGAHEGSVFSKADLRELQDHPQKGRSEGYLYQPPAQAAPELVTTSSTATSSVATSGSSRPSV